MSLTDDDKQWLSEHFATLERLAEMETKLLTAFHGWGSALKTRVKQLEDQRRPPAA